VEAVKPLGKVYTYRLNAASVHADLTLKNMTFEDGLRNSASGVGFFGGCISLYVYGASFVKIPVRSLIVLWHFDEITRVASCQSCCKHERPAKGRRTFFQVNCWWYKQTPKRHLFFLSTCSTTRKPSFTVALSTTLIIFFFFSS